MIKQHVYHSTSLLCLRSCNICSCTRSSLILHDRFAGTADTILHDNEKCRTYILVFAVNFLAMISENIEYINESRYGRLISCHSGKSQLEQKCSSKCLGYLLPSHLSSHNEMS